MILPAMQLLRKELETSCGVRTLLADLGRDFKKRPDAVVVTVVGASIPTTSRNRPPRRLPEPSAFHPEMSVLLAAYFEDYSIGLEKLAVVMVWVRDNPLIGPVNSGADQVMLRLVPINQSQQELAELWMRVGVPFLPSLLVQVSAQHQA